MSFLGIYHNNGTIALLVGIIEYISMIAQKKGAEFIIYWRVKGGIDATSLHPQCHLYFRGKKSREIKRKIPAKKKKCISL